MALSQRHRATIYTNLVPILGQEEAEALMEQFPSRDLDEPVTKEFVRAEISGVRGEISDLSGELRSGFADVRTEIAQLETRMTGRLQQLVLWIAGTNVVAVAASAVLAPRARIEHSVAPS